MRLFLKKNRNQVIFQFGTQNFQCFGDVELHTFDGNAELFRYLFVRSILITAQYKNLPALVRHTFQCFLYDMLYFRIKDQLAQLQTVTVPAGQRAQITLADGTKVWLNSESTLSYRSDFGRRDRDVELDGEAYFEVAKNKEIPFYVNTETNQVRVVGTHFNVCAYKGSNEFETTLVEGIVDIYAYDNERPLTRLTKNEFFGSYQGKYKKAVLPSYDYLRWREGLYCFDDSPFSCILTKLEKYYNVKITVENPKVLNYRCTGKFKEQDGVEHILKVIQKDHPFTYSISEEGDSIRIE